MIEAIALDLGTTSIKAALLDSQGQLSQLITQPAPPMDHQHGRYESNVLDYVILAEEVLRQCTASLHTMHIKPVLGLSCQRSSFLVWERSSGQPVTPLISWQDDRGADCCDRLAMHTEAIQKLTGLRLTAYYFAPKLSVLLRQHLDWQTKLEQGEWLTGTLDSFLIWRWTQGKHFMTDASMAARTLLMDIHEQTWSDTLCQWFEIPRPILPTIKPSVGLDLALPELGLTLQASIGDQSAACVAGLKQNHQAALVNLGTGGFVIHPCTSSALVSTGYLQTLLYQDAQRHTQFAIEGTLNSIASALAPYPTQDCRIDDLAENEFFCLAEPSGLGAPYFCKPDPSHFPPAFTDLNPREIAALLIEAIIFRIVRILEDFQAHSSLTAVYLSGGLSELTCLQQGIARCCPVPVFHLQQKEASLLGAALLARSLEIGSLTPSLRIGESYQLDSALYRKYLRWKNWLHTIVQSPKHISNA